jgi:hypothetical protein
VTGITKPLDARTVLWLNIPNSQDYNIPQPVLIDPDP